MALLTIIAGIAGLALGSTVSSKIGHSKSGTILKILLIILLLLFALWNEGLFG